MPWVAREITKMYLTPKELLERKEMLRQAVASGGAMVGNELEVNAAVAGIELLADIAMSLSRIAHAAEIIAAKNGRH